LVQIPWWDWLILEGRTSNVSIPIQGRGRKKPRGVGDATLTCSTWGITWAAERLDRSIIAIIIIVVVVVVVVVIVAIVGRSWGLDLGRGRGRCRGSRGRGRGGLERVALDAAFLTDHTTSETSMDGHGAAVRDNGTRNDLGCDGEDRKNGGETETHIEREACSLLFGVGEG
jgi:hypothetical protein